jgi:sec-independent protein translocase protein TatB
MGKMLAEFRKASNDFKRTIEDELEAEKSRESQPTPVPAPEATPPVSDVAATDAAVSAPPEAAVVPEVAAAPAPAFEGADTSGTPESEPRVDRPAEPGVSRDRSVDKS